MQLRGVERDDILIDEHQMLLIESWRRRIGIRYGSCIGHHIPTFGEGMRPIIIVKCIEDIQESCRLSDDKVPGLAHLCIPCNLTPMRKCTVDVQELLRNGVRVD